MKSICSLLELERSTFGRFARKELENFLSRRLLLVSQYSLILKFLIVYLITTLSFTRARSRSIKHERALALFSLNRDLFTIHDIQTLCGLSYALAAEVVNSTVGSQLRIAN